MSYGEIVYRGFTRALSYRGRDTRAQFWWFTVTFWFLIGLYLGSILALDGNDDGPMAILIAVVFGVLLLWGLMGHIASAVRRLHDGNMSGWWATLFVVPYVAIAVYILCSLRGTSGENRFGHDPHLIADEVARRRAAQAG